MTTLNLDDFDILARRLGISPEAFGAARACLEEAASNAAPELEEVFCPPAEDRQGCPGLPDMPKRQTQNCPP